MKLLQTWIKSKLPNIKLILKKSKNILQCKFFLWVKKLLIITQAIV